MNVGAVSATMLLGLIHCLIHGVGRGGGVLAGYDAVARITHVCVRARMNVPRIKLLSFSTSGCRVFRRQVRDEGGFLHQDAVLLHVPATVDCGRRQVRPRAMEPRRAAARGTERSLHAVRPRQAQLRRAKRSCCHDDDLCLCLSLPPLFLRVRLRFCGPGTLAERRA